MTSLGILVSHVLCIYGIETGRYLIIGMFDDACMQSMTHMQNQMVLYHLPRSSVLGRADDRCTENTVVVVLLHVRVQGCNGAMGRAE